ncbi:MAG: hypothetical protein GY874_19005 [Desulfobacteraceae bacterium]|nr:hypothetical protein [Desulfobacteraceae bacterium]
MLIKLIVWGVFIYVIYRALRNCLGVSGKQRTRFHGKIPGNVDNEMIKDPVCGSYFPVRQGVRFFHEGKYIHVCSQACRDRFLNELAAPDKE